MEEKFYKKKVPINTFGISSEEDDGIININKRTQRLIPYNIDSLSDGEF